MAIFTFDGLAELEGWAERIAEIPPELKEEILIAQGDIIAEYTKQTAASMLQGPYNKGAVQASVTRYQPMVNGPKPYVKVSFAGTQHGEALGTIAFFNEYGKVNQPARPFVWTADAKGEPEAVAAAEKLFNEWIGE